MEVRQALREYFTKEHTRLTELAPGKLRITSVSVTPTIIIEEVYNKLQYLQYMQIIGECEDSRLGPYRTQIFPHEFDTLTKFKELFKIRLLELMDEAEVAIENQKWKDRQLKLFN